MFVLEEDVFLKRRVNKLLILMGVVIVLDMEKLVSIGKQVDVVLKTLPVSYLPVAI